MDPGEVDITRPETFLSPGQLAETDQWEMQVKEHCEQTLELMKEMEQDRPQSLTSWSYLMGNFVGPEQLGINLAYFMLRIAKAEIEAERNG